MPSVCETLSSSVKHGKPSVKIIICHTIMGNTVLTVVHRIMLSVFFFFVLLCFVFLHSCFSFDGESGSGTDKTKSWNCCCEEMTCHDGVG